MSRKLDEVRATVTVLENTAAYPRTHADRRIGELASRAIPGFAERSQGVKPYITAADVEASTRLAAKISDEWLASVRVVNRMTGIPNQSALTIDDLVKAGRQYTRSLKCPPNDPEAAGHAQICSAFREYSMTLGELNLNTVGRDFEARLQQAAGESAVRPEAVDIVLDFPWQLITAGTNGREGDAHVVVATATGWSKAHPGALSADEKERLHDHVSRFNTYCDLKEFVGDTKGFVERFQHKNDFDLRVANLMEFALDRVNPSVVATCASLLDRDDDRDAFFVVANAGDELADLELNEVSDILRRADSYAGLVADLGLDDDTVSPEMAREVQVKTNAFLDRLSEREGLDLFRQPLGAALLADKCVGSSMLLRTGLTDDFRQALGEWRAGRDVVLNHGTPYAELRLSNEDRDLGRRFAKQVLSDTRAAYPGLADKAQDYIDDTREVEIASQVSKSKGRGSR